MAVLDFQHLKVDLRQFSYIVAIADCRSISAAALKLGIAQPSLSEAVSRLEKDLGYQLIVRTARGIEFTNTGTALAKLGRSILDEMSSELPKIDLLGKQDGGVVSVSIPPSFSILLGVQLAETVKNQYPNIQLSINEVTSLIAQERVASGDFDFGIIYHGLTPSEFVEHALMEEEFFLAAAPDNWEPVEVKDGIALKPIRFRELSGLPLVLAKRPNGLRVMMERTAKKAHVVLNIAFEIDSLRNMVSMATRASAYAIVPKAVVTREIRNREIILIPVVEPTVLASSSIIRKAGRPISQASLAVEGLIKIILREQIKRHGLKASLLGDH